MLQIGILSVKGIRQYFPNLEVGGPTPSAPTHKRNKIVKYFWQINIFPLKMEILRTLAILMESHHTKCIFHQIEVVSLLGDTSLYQNTNGLLTIYF